MPFEPRIEPSTGLRLATVTTPALESKTVTPAASYSIVVMPFDNLSSDPENGYFARGFVEDLIADLARFSELRVMAGASSFALPSLDRTVEEIASEWRADHVLTGSVRRRDDTLRVTTQLLDAADMQLVWAERFDANVDSVFDIQDAITAKVAGKLAIRVGDARLQRARERSLEELAAYDCWLRGLDHLRRGTLEDDAESRVFFEHALDVDPDYARAFSGLAVSHFNEWTCQSWHLFDESGRGAFRYATRAAELDDGDAMVQSVLSRIHRFRYEHVDADRCAARALAINPNDAHVLINVAITKLFGGEPDVAHELATKAIDLNPLHGAWYGGIAGWSLFMAGESEGALELLDGAGDSIVNFAAYRAACHASQGDEEAARRAFGEFEVQFTNKITFGREPEVGEALRWAVQVEPFRRIEDSRKMPDRLCGAGIGSIDVEQAIATRPLEMVRPADIEAGPGCVFKKAGDVWEFKFKGTGARLVELKGFHDLARLLVEPEVPIHCLELSGAPPAYEAPQEVLDLSARREYRARIEELQAELEEAEANHDTGRAERSREELESVIDELAKASGIAGRTRNLDLRVERARTATTWRVRSAIKKIGVAHPRLGQHLDNSIKTGTFCVYVPENDIDWEV